MKKFFLLCLSISIIGYIFFQKNNSEYVNVYNWYGQLPREVIEQFERETNIKVNYDVFDNNEMLEAKLFASNSGYDVVFPSAIPYAKRQIAANIYMPLNFSLLPNYKLIHPHLLKEIKKIDPELRYVLPYIWGTTGIIYNKDILDKLPIKKEHLDSVQLLFNEESAKQIAPYGISFLDEAIDVFPMLYRALELYPYEHSTQALSIGIQHLKTIRPFIKRFSSDRISNDILTDEIAAAMYWSGDAYRTILMGKKIGKNLVFFIPKEGASLWIDTIAIPKGAPNPQNAHKFINFCLRPDIAAMITNELYIITAINTSTSHIDPKILEKSFLFPSQDEMKKLILDTSSQTNDFEKKRLRLWTKIKKKQYGDLN